MLASKNLIPPVKDQNGGLHWIDLLAGELCVRLKQAREMEEGLWPKTLVLTHRSGRGYVNASKSRQMPFAFTKALTGEYIAKLGRRMWGEVVIGLKREGNLDVHNLGLQFTGVARLEEGQQNIEGFLAESSKKRYRSVSPEDPLKWKCPKCSEVLAVASEGELEVMKQEHEDYHFALDLQRTVEGSGEKKRKKERDKGIRSFFKPK